MNRYFSAIYRQKYNLHFQPFIEVTLEDLELEINNAELDNVFNEYQDQLKTLNSEYTEKLKTLNEQVETLSEIKAEKELLEKQLKETIEKVKIMESEKIDFRIKIGNLKEKLKVAEEDNENLKNKTKSLKELTKIQHENETLKHQFKDYYIKGKNFVHCYLLLNIKNLLISFMKI